MSLPFCLVDHCSGLMQIVIPLALCAARRISLVQALTLLQRHISLHFAASDAARRFYGFTS